MGPLVSGVPANSAEATRDLQDRLGRFARWAFIVSGTILLASVSADLAAGPGGRGIGVASRSVQVASEVLLLVVWRLCRGKALRPGALAITDAVGTIGVCIGWASMGLGYPDKEPIEFTVMLATTYTLMGRSVLVPSSFTRTLAISDVQQTPARAAGRSIGARS